MKICSKFRFLSLLLVIIISVVSCIQQPSEFSDSDDLIIYPSPPSKTRIQYLTSFSSSAEFTGGQSQFNKFLFGEEEALPIVKPYGIAVSGPKIFICDPGINGLAILDLQLNTFDNFIPGGKGQLQLPLNCSTDKNGRIYVADGGRKQIVIFDKDLNYINEITLQGGSKPTDVYVDDKSIWVTAIDNHKILSYNISDLKFKGSFPKAEQNEAEYIYQPLGLDLSDNKVYISDPGSCSVKIFDTEYNYLNTFGSPGKGFSQFTRPKGISSDRDGNVYVVDAAFENIQIFNPEGNLLLHFGGTYNGPGGMWLPADVCINYENLSYFEKFVDPSFKLEYLIYVTNQFGPDKVSVYGFVGLTE